jgi:hypothetical protein
MHRALWLLIGLQLKGWLRFAKRNASSVRGVIFLLVGLFVSCGWLMSFLMNPSTRESNPEFVERFGPLFLLGGCLISLLLSSGERVISFRPAEVDFLFPGPFTRRQLLLYKTTGILASALFQALIFLVVRQWGGRLLCAYLGMVLLLLFFQFFTLALSMLASAVGARAYSRSRKAVLAVLGLLVVVAVAHGMRGHEDPAEALLALEQSSAWQVVRTPLSWFVKAFRADHVWPDFLQYGGLALAVNLLLVGLIFALDAEYLEASAAASERLYQRLQRLRSGQGVLAASSGSGKARFSLPMPPRWGGVGPTVWRQCLVVARSFLPLLLMLLIGGVSIAIALSAGQRDKEGDALVWSIAGILIGFPVFMTQTVLCDFRGDVDRMDVLKALPIAPARLALGQLLAPSLVVSVVQGIVAVIVQIVIGRVEPLLVAVPLLAFPANFVLFGIENLLFLLFPVRMIAASPGDFQTSGRTLVIFFAKFLCLGPVLLAGVLAWILVLLITDSMAAGLAAAWVVALGCGIGLIPLVVIAFNRFDVTRDTPT